MGRWIKVAAIASAVAGATTALAAPGGAATTRGFSKVLTARIAATSTTSGVLAAETGQQACAILASGTLECFASDAAMNQALGTNAGATPTRSSGITPDTACSNNNTEWLYLYKNANFGSPTLGVQQTNLWIDLQSYGFGNSVSSWDNETGCYAYGSKSTSGGGSLLTMAPFNYSSYVGSAWNDQMNSVEISG
ncbi:MAG: hypothetical protein JWM85_3554 [Acidimicrobiaceae bacterium]|nr:hypothetical protein [Acidimicrobiaceae bacterium]